MLSTGACYARSQCGITIKRQRNQQNREGTQYSAGRRGMINNQQSQRWQRTEASKPRCPAAKAKRWDAARCACAVHEGLRTTHEASASPQVPCTQTVEVPPSPRGHQPPVSCLSEASKPRHCPAAALYRMCWFHRGTSRRSRPCAGAEGAPAGGACLKARL